MLAAGSGEDGQALNRAGGRLTARVVFGSRGPVGLPPFRFP